MLCLLRRLLLMVTLAIALGAAVHPGAVVAAPPEAVLLPPSAPAEASVLKAPTPQRLRELLAELASRDYPRREQATRTLLELPLSEKAVDDLFAAAETPEQRHRLMEVARHHFIRGLAAEIADGRGALGVHLPRQTANPRILPLPDAPAITVLNTFAGFPAYACLRPGDRIVAVDSQPFDPAAPLNEQVDAFIQDIQARPPGQQVRLSVQRDGRTIEVAVELGSLAALQALYTGNDEALLLAAGAGQIALPHLRLQPQYEARWLDRLSKLPAHRLVTPR